MEQNISEKSELNTPVEKEDISKSMKKSNKKVIGVGILFLLILILVLGVFYFISSNNSNLTSNSSPTPSASADTTSPTSQKFPAKSTNPGWETYVKSAEAWQIDYPSSEDFEIQVREGSNIGPSGIGEAIAFIKFGETQSRGTEMYDGIIFNIGVQEKEESQSIKEVADERTKPDENVGSTRTPLKAISLNGLDGWETTVSGLGEFRIIFLENPDDDEKVYYISILSTGPGENEDKYDKISEEMLSTFKPITN